MAEQQRYFVQVRMRDTREVVGQTECLTREEAVRTLEAKRAWWQGVSEVEVRQVEDPMDEGPMDEGPVTQSLQRLYRVQVWMLPGERVPLEFWTRASNPTEARAKARMACLLLGQGEPYNSHAQWMDCGGTWLD